MKLSIALSALLVTGFMAVTTEPASAVIYCQYVDYPAGCTVRAGVVLRPRPVARAVATPGRRCCGHAHEPRRPGGSRWTASALSAAIADRPIIDFEVERTSRRQTRACATATEFFAGQR